MTESIKINREQKRERGRIDATAFSDAIATTPLALVADEIAVVEGIFGSSFARALRNPVRCSAVLITPAEMPEHAFPPDIGIQFINKPLFYIKF